MGEPAKKVPQQARREQKRDARSLRLQAASLSEMGRMGLSSEMGRPEVGRPEAAWRLETFFGRLAEISGGPATAALTLTFQLVREAQKLDQPVAWITERSSSFFPPDAAETGVDLGALIVIRLPSVPHLPRMRLATRAADQLLRSGGFGLVVLDCVYSGSIHSGSVHSGRTDRRYHVPLPMLSRLSGLARKHRAALLFLTEKSNDQPSLGSLISIRAEASRTQKISSEKIGDRYGCVARVLKDKRNGLGWGHLEVCRVPSGLR